MALKSGEDSIGNGSDAHLKGGAIFDEFRTVGTDFGFDLGYWFCVHFRYRGVVLDECMDVVNVNKAVAVGARHVAVDLGDDVFGGNNGRTGCFDGHP